MVRLRPQFRFLIAFIVAVSLGSTLTACSKDDKKGTPISQRDTGGNAPAADTGDRGSDTIEGEKATPANPSDLNQRGSGTRAAGVQISRDGIPAEAVKELQEASANDTEIRTTHVNNLGVSSNLSLLNTDAGIGGELTINDVNTSSLDDYYQWLTVARPDYSTVHVRANHRSYPPITTLGTNPAIPERGLQGGEFDFTDYADDLALNTVLRLSMKTSNPGDYNDLRAGHNNFLPQEFFDQSREFAADIKDIRAEVTSISRGNGPYSFASAKLTYDYEGSEYVLDLYGIMNQSTGQAVLAQRSENHGHNFQGYLTCLDQHGVSAGCQNSILVVEQVKGGKICKRIFAVIRHTHVAMQMSRDEYRSYFTESNPQKRAFLQYIANTIVNDRYQDGIIVPEDGDDDILFGTGMTDDQGRRIPVIPVPYVERMTTRTFAIAHGYGESELFMRESDYETLYPNQMTNPARKDNRKDIIKIVAPLAKPTQGNNLSTIVDIYGFIQDEVEDWVQPWSNETLMRRLISSAEVVGNDGRGTMEVKFNFGSDSLMIVFTGRNVPVYDPRDIKLYPYQGVQAPENITKDMMPLRF